MPTIRVAFIEPWSGSGYEGAFLEGDLSLAQEETLQKVLKAVDPDLEAKSGSATVPVSGSNPVVSRTALAGDRLRGLVATSDRLVRFELVITGRDALVFRCEVATPALPIMLPGSFKLNNGDTVDIIAYNESDQGVASVAAVLLWRNDVA